MPKQILGFECGVQDRPMWMASLGRGISGLSCPTSAGSPSCMGCCGVSAIELAANTSAKCTEAFLSLRPPWLTSRLQLVLSGRI